MSDAAMDAVNFGLMLILPISALAARRLAVGDTLRIALAWFAIFGVLFALVVLWQTATGTGSALGGLSR